MAVNLFTGATNNNWGTATNWSQGTVPTSNDGHVATFDATSPNCTVNTSNRVCNNIDFTSYTNTITMTFNITVTGNITFGTAMNVSGSGIMTVNASSTITSNGFSWPNAFTFASTAGTYTLADDMNVNGTLTLGGTTNSTINGNTIFAGGNLSVTLSTAGTATIVMDGTGTWSGSVQLQLNLTFNTAGTITVASNVGWSTKTLTYVAGTMVMTGSTLTVNNTTAGSLNTSGMTWNNVTIGTSGSTATLLSNLNVGGNFSTGAATSTVLNGLFNINVVGNMTIANNGVWSGTASVVLTGTGTWSGSGRIGVNLTINTVGTRTISGSVNFGNSKTLTYTSGTVVTTSSTLVINTSATLNTSGIVWNNVTITLGITVTNTSAMTINGTFTVGSTTSTTTLNGSTINLNGNFVVNVTGGIVTGTSVITITGTSTWTMPLLTTNGILRTPFTINTSGTFTLSGTLRYGTGPFTYTAAATVVSTGSTLNFRDTMVVNNTGLNFSTLNLGNSCTFSGTNGFTVQNLACTTVGLTHTFQVGEEYIVTGSINLTATAASTMSLISSSSGSQAFITLENSGSTSQDLSFINAIDINSNNGLTLWTYKGALSNATNWKVLVPPQTMASVF